MKAVAMPQIRRSRGFRQHDTVGMERKVVLSSVSVTASTHVLLGGPGCSGL